MELYKENILESRRSVAVAMNVWKASYIVERTCMYTYSFLRSADEIIAEYNSAFDKL